MNTIDHGKWVAYTPTALPEGAPANALFAQRESDAADWYDYVNAGSNFQPGNVVITAFFRTSTSQHIVGAATQTHTSIFPAGCIVHEITDYTGSDPQADLGSKAFDPATGDFTDPILPPQTGALQDMEARLKALETKLGGA